MADMPQPAHENIKAKASELGFLECALVPAGTLAEEKTCLTRWTEEGMQGTMDYMARNRDKRLDPRLLVENARTLIIVLHNYYSPELPADPEAPIISRYARGKDYHQVIKKKLGELLRFIQTEITPCHGRAFTDSAPVLERAWARRAGLGWIGKNSMLISPEYGSYFFIGELIIDAEIPTEPITEVPDRCGTCTRCIDACPTRAIITPRIIDARRCISYQTIELRGDQNPELTPLFRNRLFGCDICQEVCPWNRKATPHHEPDYQPLPGLLQLTREEWLNMTEEQFNARFRESPLRRTGYAGIRRTLLNIQSS